ncbi:MAG TPA: matrixin family metalloprotease [Terriglobia bacterium]|nr:matrixin family metalloprotease [Terriglobia bacterium]
MIQKQNAGRTTRIASGAAAAAAMLSAVLVFGYNPFQDNLGTLTAPVPVVARWNSMPVAWMLNADTPKSNVATPGCTPTSGSATCIQQSLTAGFTTWTNAMVAGQDLTTVSAQFSGMSTLTMPVFDDCQNVIGFSDTTSSDFSTGTIAFTEVATVTRQPGTSGPFQYQCRGGTPKVCNSDDCIAGADMEFNPSEKFTTSSTPPMGTFNLQSVATHEEGHLLGLDHSGIGHTVMFPYGDSTAAGQQTQLAADDAIGISFLYPTTNFATATGVVSGHVSLSGSGIFGAHVVAVNANTGNAVIDGLTAPDGTYTLTGVPPGLYYVLALPLAGSSDSGVLTIENFSGWECGYADSGCKNAPQNPTSYTGRYH